MNTLAESYRVRSRFHRSVRIDTDSLDAEALDGYVLNGSALSVLQRVAGQVSDSRQRAFTWTGPYGGGKSSLAVFLSAFVGADETLRKKTEKALGTQRTRELRKGLPLGDRGWIVVRVAAARATPLDAIAEALDRAIDERWKTRKPGRVQHPTDRRDTSALLDNLIAVGEEARKQGDGLLVLIDEMGKLLEHAAATSGDLHFFQEIAERFARADAHCIVIGILHQAFQEYAAAADRVARAEWAKVQGRYSDIPFTVSVTEVVDLIGSALDGPTPGRPVEQLCREIAHATEDAGAGSAATSAERLVRCWPLHPLTALLLGPISRRRFGQNERSLFSWLCSGESRGLSDFLKTTKPGPLVAYRPDLLWDYLQQNLEPAILASPDGHRWANAAEGVERAMRAGGEFAGQVAKTVALLETFGRQFNLRASNNLLRAAWGQSRAKNVAETLDLLKAHSVLIYREHVAAWGLFEGSDIDLEAELRDARQGIVISATELAQESLGLTPVLAKRHYHDTGTLRWFSKDLVFSSSLSDSHIRARIRKGAAGSFTLILPSPGDSKASTEASARQWAQNAKDAGLPVVFGISDRTAEIVALLTEVMSIRKVQVNLPAIEGDAVARRELYGRMQAVEAQLGSAVREAFVEGTWFDWTGIPARPNAGSLSPIASEFADRLYPQTPWIKNELINRGVPSSNAVAARRALLHRMVLSGASENLGIEGYPPEYGLYVSILKKTRLHRPVRGKPSEWEFAEPTDKRDQEVRLAPLWTAATSLLNEVGQTPVPLSAIYEAWRKPPFGVRDGLLPVLAVSFVLSRESELAVYVDDRFVPRLDDTVIDDLLQSAERVGLRRFRVKGVRQSALQRFAEFVAGMVEQPELSTPLDIAKPLVKFARSLHPFAQRTGAVGERARAVREVLLNSSDPYALLFEDLPRACGLMDVLEEAESRAIVRDVVNGLAEALHELRNALPATLESLRRHLLERLAVPSEDDNSLEVLQERAKRVNGLSGDFRMEAFAKRLQSATTDPAWMDGLCSFAVAKPSRDWTDTDLVRIRLELGELASRFRKVERYAAAQLATPGALTIAMTIGDGREVQELDIAVPLSFDERMESKRLLDDLKAVLDNGNSQGRASLIAAVRLAQEMVSRKAEEDDAKEAPAEASG